MSAAAVSADDSARNTSTSFEFLPRDSIMPSPLNPRKVFDPEDLQDLAESIKVHGILEPIVVRRRLLVDRFADPDAAQPAEYLIVMGERRWQAAGIAGLQLVPSIIRTDIRDDAHHTELALIENLQRRDIDPIEEADGYAKLLELGYTQKSIAEAVHRSQPAIANSLRLRELPSEVKAHVSRGRISGSHGKALASYAHRPEVVETLADFAIKAKLSSKSLEKMDWQQFSVLQAKKLAIAITNVHAFDVKAVCEGKCNDYRSGGYCLNPECYRAKCEEGDAARRRAIEDKAEDGMVSIDALKWDEYTSMGPNPPVGCREDCEHRKTGVRGNGSVSMICLDRKCNERLHLKAESAKKKAMREGLAALRDQAVQDLAAHRRPEHVAMLACWTTIANAKKASLSAAIERLGLGISADLIKHMGYRDWERRLVWDALTAIPAADLMNLAAEVMLLDDIANQWEYGGDPDYVRWFLGLDPTDERPQETPEGSTTADAADTASELDCENCSQPPEACEGCPVAAAEESACRRCGCTEDQACPGGCCWIENDLCSACIEECPECHGGPQCSSDCGACGGRGYVEKPPIAVEGLPEASDDL